jgi:hypothetical protein
MLRLARTLALAALVAGCGTTGTGSEEPEESAAAAPSPTEAPPTATEAPTATPEPMPSESSEPPQLLGTWRTTLAGQTVTLRLSPDEYSIHRGSSAGTGSIAVDGDRIDFFDSSLCEGTGEYRWSIDGDSLRFTLVTEPCPGRAEALLNVVYGDYSPPS